MKLTELTEAKSTSIEWDVWKDKSPADQERIKKNNPNLKILNQPKERKPRESKAPKVDLEKIARKIEAVVSNTFPDGDPIDLLAPFFKRQYGIEYDISKYLDQAARKHLGAKSYDNYLANMWDDVADDKLMPDHVTRDNNPWAHARSKSKLPARVKGKEITYTHDDAFPKTYER